MSVGTVAWLTIGALLWGAMLWFVVIGPVVGWWRERTRRRTERWSHG